jgi:hypothetical protein
LLLVGHARGTADRIIETIENATRLGPALDVMDLAFSVDDLPELSTDHKTALHNPYLPGYGEPTARLVIVGTEHAFDFDAPRPRGPTPDACFAMADCGLHALWLADGAEIAPELAEHISGQVPRGDALPGHRHPYEFLYPVPSGHMWRRLSRMMASAGFKLELGASRRWGAAAYMFELSDVAAASQGRGRLPSAERRAFLPEIVRSLEDARALVFHGRWNEAEWDAIREPIAAAFLGDAAAPQVGAWTHGPASDYRFATSHDDAKLVVLMQSPTRRGPTNAFLDEVGGLIRPYCAPTADS